MASIDTFGLKVENVNAKKVGTELIAMVRLNRWLA